MNRIFLAQDGAGFRLICEDTIGGAVTEFAAFDRPMALLALDLSSLTMRDVSEHAAMLVACRVVDGRITLTDAIRDFIERYSMPGPLLPAAA